MYYPFLICDIEYKNHNLINLNNSIYLIQNLVKTDVERENFVCNYEIIDQNNCLSVCKEIIKYEDEITEYIYKSKKLRYKLY